MDLVAQRMLPVIAFSLALVALSGCVLHSSDSAWRDDLAAIQPDGEGLVTNPAGNVHVTLVMPGTVAPGTRTEWEVQVAHHGTRGDEPFPYSEVCHSPWVITLQDDAGRTFSTHEPLPECEASSTAYLEPGTAIGVTWTWDARPWNTNQEAYEDLPAGDYRLTFLFERQDSDEGRGGGPSAMHLFTIG